jgi:hypothetical protein
VKNCQNIDNKQFNQMARILHSTKAKSKSNKELQMRLKKIFAMGGSILILSSGLMVFAQQGQTDGSQALTRYRVQNRFEVRPMYVDENGDGICDVFRDHDNDGIPNRQDPDWIRPQDGSGYQNGQGGQNAQNRLGNRNAFMGENGQAFKGDNGQRFGNRSFRNNNGGLGSGVCDLTGPKGNGNRGGNK